MNPWLATTVVLSTAIVVGIVRAVMVRLEKRRRARTVEKPNSHYTPKLVLDRDARNRWRSIPLERIHEINREEVRRLVNKVEALGVDGLTIRERDFLERMAELYPPPPGQIGASSKPEDSFWADPFGLELGTRDANR